MVNMRLGATHQGLRVRIHPQACYSYHSYAKVTILLAVLRDMSPEIIELEVRITSIAKV